MNKIRYMYIHELVRGLAVMLWRFLMFRMFGSTGVSLAVLACFALLSAAFRSLCRT